MRSIWKWSPGVLVAAPVLLFGYQIFRYGWFPPHVTQSDGWLEIENAPKGFTLSGSLPPSATEFCFAQSGVGLGGRLRAYAVKGSAPELHQLAKAEFAAHPYNPGSEIDQNKELPFNLDYIEFLEDSYYVDLNWLRPAAKATGSVYSAKNQDVYSPPLIFVDGSGGVLYFVMTD